MKFSFREIFPVGYPGCRWVLSLNLGILHVLSCAKYKPCLMYYTIQVVILHFNIIRIWEKIQRLPLFHDQTLNNGKWVILPIWWWWWWDKVIMESSLLEMFSFHFRPPKLFRRVRDLGHALIRLGIIYYSVQTHLKQYQIPTIETIL